MDTRCLPCRPISSPWVRYLRNSFLMMPRTICLNLLTSRSIFRSIGAMRVPGLRLRDFGRAYNGGGRVPREKRIHGGDGLRPPSVPPSVDVHEREAVADEGVPEERVQLLAPVAAVALGVGHPRRVRVEEQVEIRGGARDRALDPLRTVAVVVAAVDHRAEQGGVEDEQAARPREGLVPGADLPPPHPLATRARGRAAPPARGAAART